MRLKSALLIVIMMFERSEKSNFRGTHCFSCGNRSEQTNCDVFLDRDKFPVSDQLEVEESFVAYWAR